MTDLLEEFSSKFERIKARVDKPKDRPRAGRSGNAAPDSIGPPNQIPLTFFRELSRTPIPKLWLIKNVIARGEVSSWIGKPGGGKSALMTDIAVHGACSSEWRGYRIPGPFGSVIFALERADLTKRRLQAHRLRDGLPDDLPIAVAGQIISLIDPNCVDLIVDAINRAQDGFGREVGLAVFDTRSKGIAAGGGDEDKARFQNMAAAHLRRVIERTNGRLHIASVGHTGKDPGKGERGSNATLGDVDVEGTISGDAVRTVNITKANDQPLGRLTTYDMEPYELGVDEDGEPYRAWIVASQIAEHSQPTGDAPKAPLALSDKQRLAMEALTEVLLSDSKDVPSEYGLPAKIKKVVSADKWREEMERRQIIGGKNPRARYGELRTALQARHAIGVRDDVVWDAR